MFSPGVSPANPWYYAGVLATGEYVISPKISGARVGIGTTSPNGRLTVLEEYTDPSTSRYALAFETDPNVTVNANNNHFGVAGVVQIAINLGVTESGTVYGIQAGASRNQADDFGTLANQVGNLIEVGHLAPANASIVTTAVYGSQIKQYASVGTMTNVYGVAVLKQTSGATVARSYGLYLDPVAGTTIFEAIHSEAGAVVLNETGGDYDMRFEGDTDANTFFLDASVDSIGIGTASPNEAKLYVNKAVTNPAQIGGIDPTVINALFTPTVTGNTAISLSGISGAVTPIISTLRTVSASYSGLRFSAVRDNASDLGTLSQFRGTQVSVGHTSTVGATATTTDVYGHLIQTYAQVGTITNLYGVYVQNSGTGGTITNSYGIYSDPIPGATITRSFYGTKDIDTALGYMVAGAAASGFVIRGNGTRGVFAQLQAGDIGGGAALTRVDDTNVTLVLGGAPTTALLAATSLTLGWTGTLAVARGGWGLATLTAHALYVGNGTSAPTALAVGATNTVLHGITGANPAFSAVVEADLGLTDLTTANVTSSAHGFAPKSPGDTTKFLNGGATPAWSVPLGGFKSMQVLTSGTTYTTPSGITTILVFVVGAGGGGGGARSGIGSGAVGGGGGAGGTAVKLITSAASSYTYAIGAGGTAGAATPTVGGNGGNSTFNTTIVGGGGTGGGTLATSVLGFAIGGAGGTASGGDYNITGGPGQTGSVLAAATEVSGGGGDNAFGGGGIPVAASTAGNNGGAYGGGASGAASTGAASAAGGVGAAGVIIVYEYT